MRILKVLPISEEYVGYRVHGNMNEITGMGMTWWEWEGLGIPFLHISTMD